MRELAPWIGLVVILAGWVITYLRREAVMNERLSTLTESVGKAASKESIAGRLAELDRMFDKSFKYHAEHFAHANNTDLHETNRERDAKKLEIMALTNDLIRHGDHDDKRFERLETTLDGIRDDIKDILKVVSR